MLNIVVLAIEIVSTIDVILVAEIVSIRDILIIFKSVFVVLIAGFVFARVLFIMSILFVVFVSAIEGN